MTHASYLITGGTGSFGQAFTRHLLHAGAERVAILSRDEAKQAAMRQAFGDDHRLRFMIGDVRDEKRLYRAMQSVDVVVAAAALKRVEVAEVDADECAKTNVLGAMNVISAATDAGVSKVVQLSTDKACAPLNAYGASKLLAEKLMLAANAKRGATGPRFAVTRYGNVAGSRGSVIPLWREALRRGDRIFVTDPEMTRYWMRMDEAVQLVAWTIATMEGGELVVPDLPAYRLGDLAGAMARTWHCSAPRPGEKKHEAMIGPEEMHLFRRVGTYFVARAGDPPPDELDEPHSSDRARRLSFVELKTLLQEVV